MHNEILLEKWINKNGKSTMTRKNLEVDDLNQYYSTSIESIREKISEGQLKLVCIVDSEIKVFTDTLKDTKLNITKR